MFPSRENPFSGSTKELYCFSFENALVSTFIESEIVFGSISCFVAIILEHTCSSGKFTKEENHYKKKIV